jgi:AraC family transcriptional regulator
LRTQRQNPSEASLHYVERINRAIDHIVRHLDEPLDLETIAGVAYFSPFHFHRIFRALVGETLTQFIKRLRLEKALTLLSRDPRKSLTKVALACGFSSSSDFSRCFKQRYGVPPSAFNLETFRQSRREELDALVAPDAESRRRLLHPQPGENPDGFTVALRHLPARTIAYIRVVNPYESLEAVRNATQRLEAWAEARGLADGQWLGYQWEDPEIVALKDCRYDVGLVVPDAFGFEPEGEFGRYEFPPMLVAQVEMRGPIDMEVRLLDWFYRTWLPTSGYVPDDQPGFEAWIGRPFAHGMEHFEIHAQIPILRG